MYQNCQVGQLQVSTLAPSGGECGQCISASSKWAMPSVRGTQDVCVLEDAPRVLFDFTRPLEEHILILRRKHAYMAGCAGTPCRFVGFFVNDFQGCCFLRFYRQMLSIEFAEKCWQFLAATAGSFMSCVWWRWNGGSSWQYDEIQIKFQFERFKVFLPWSNLTIS